MTLTQHLEEYRKKQKDFPTYAELVEYQRQHDEEINKIKEKQ